MPLVARITFLVLVGATFAAFFVAQRLKSAAPVIHVNGLMRYWSPNGDGNRDVNRFSVSLKTADDVTVDVVNLDGDRVKRLSDGVHVRAYRPLRLVWDGTTDAGAPAADGQYRLRVALRAEGRSATVQKTMDVDRRAPRPVLCVGVPCSDRRELRNIYAPGSGPVRVYVPGVSPLFETTFRVLRTDDGRPREVARFTRAAGFHRAQWDGLVDGAPAPRGIYLIEVSVRDRAGNVGTTPARVEAGAVPGRPGVTVRGIAAQPPLRPVTAGRRVEFFVDARGRSYRWRVRRVGDSAVRKRGSESDPHLAFRAPPGPSGAYLLELRSGRWHTTVPFLVQAERRSSVLVVVPVVTWLGSDRVDDPPFDGIPNTLTGFGSLTWPRVFAGKDGLPAGFAGDVAPLLVFLDRRRIRYDLTSDLDLDLTRNPRASDREGVLLAGTERWVTRPLARRLRRYVSEGGNVAIFGADSLRRGVTLRVQQSGEAGTLSRATRARRRRPVRRAGRPSAHHVRARAAEPVRRRHRLRPDGGRARSARLHAARGVRAGQRGSHEAAGRGRPAAERRRGGGGPQVRQAGARAATRAHRRAARQGRGHPRRAARVAAAPRRPQRRAGDPQHRRPAARRRAEDPVRAMSATAAVGDGVLVTGMVLAAVLAAAAVLGRSVRGRAWAMLGALVLTPMLLAAEIWNAPQVESVRGRGLLAVAAVAVAVAAMGALAWLLARRPGLLGLLALAALPFRVPVQAGGSTANLLLPLYVVIGAGALAWLVPRLGSRYAGEPAERSGALEWVLLGSVVLYALQAVYADDSAKALEQVVFFYAPFALLFALLRGLAWTPRQLAWGGGALVALALAFAAVGFWEFQTRTLLLNPKVIASNQIEEYFRVNSLFFDPNIYGRFLALVMLGLAGVLLWARRPRALAWTIVALVVLWGGLLTTLSQSSFAALLLGLAVLAALRFGVRAAVLPALAALAVALVIVFAFPSALRIDFGSSKSIDDATSGRVDLIRGGLDLAREKPLAGWGSGSFTASYRRREHSSGREATSASHTIPITVAAEQGAIGLVAYFALLALALRRLLRGARDAPVRAVIAAGFAALVLHTWLYAAFLEDPVTWTLLALGTALAAPAAARAGDGEDAAAPLNGHRREPAVAARTVR